MSPNQKKEPIIDYLTELDLKNKTNTYYKEVSRINSEIQKYYDTIKSNAKLTKFNLKDTELSEYLKENKELFELDSDVLNKYISNYAKNLTTTEFFKFDEKLKNVKNTYEALELIGKLDLIPINFFDSFKSPNSVTIELDLNIDNPIYLSDTDFTPKFKLKEYTKFDFLHFKNIKTINTKFLPNKGKYGEKLLISYVSYTTHAPLLKNTDSLFSSENNEFVNYIKNNTTKLNFTNDSIQFIIDDSRLFSITITKRN